MEVRGAFRGVPLEETVWASLPRPSVRARALWRPTVTSRLRADLVPERALVIERDGGRRHQLVIASRL